MYENGDVVIWGNTNNQSGHTTVYTGANLPQTNVKITTPQMQSGQTTFDKILSTFLSSFALAKGAGYVPTTTQPQQQIPYFPPAIDNSNYGGAGATLGASLQNFVTNNTGVIAVAVVGYVLLMSGRKK